MLTAATSCVSAIGCRTRNAGGAASCTAAATGLNVPGQGRQGDCMLSLLLLAEQLLASPVVGSDKDRCVLQVALIVHL
jgi:hypothetical protein